MRTMSGLSTIRSPRGSRIHCHRENLRPGRLGGVERCRRAASRANSRMAASELRSPQPRIRAARRTGAMRRRNSIPQPRPRPRKGSVLGAYARVRSGSRAQGVHAGCESSRCSVPSRRGPPPRRSSGRSERHRDRLSPLPCFGPGGSSAGTCGRAASPMPGGIAGEAVERGPARAVPAVDEPRAAASSCRPVSCRRRHDFVTGGLKICDS